MLSNLQTSKSDLTAGIIALTLTEEYRFTPHKVLTELELAHVTSMVQKSFTGLADITSRAAKTVKAFDDLQRIVAQGREYFFGDGSPLAATRDPSLPLRQVMYHAGKEEGFDRCAKKIEKNLRGPMVIEGRYYDKAEVLDIMRRCKELEVQRVQAAQKLYAGIIECNQRVIKDRHLLNTLCAVTGYSDSSEFERLRREETLQSTKSLLAWERNSTNPGSAFQTTLSFDGWLTKLATFEEAFAKVAQETGQMRLVLGHAITPQRKAALASVVVKLLDEFVVIARKNIALPESPIKDILRVHFFLTELQKQLPVEVADQHKHNLTTITSRLLGHPEFHNYLAELERDTLVTEEDKTLLLQHFVLAQSQRPNPIIATDESPSQYKKRSEIRRQIKASIERDRMELGVQELLQRMLELREAAPMPAAHVTAPIKFFPARLEQDFEKWVGDFQDFIQEGIRGLIQNAAKGEPVDSKPLRRETKITELRFAGAGGIRIYVTRAGSGDFHVLAFGSKQTQEQDISNAIDRFRGL